MKTAALATALAVALSASLVISGQTAPDPLRTLLEDSVKSGSLGVEGTPALHIDGKFSVQNYDGKSKTSTGTLAVDFLKPGFTKITAREEGASAGEVATSGTFMERLLVDLFLHPGPVPEELGSSSLKEKNQKFGSLTLRCITLQPDQSQPTRFGVPLQVYCLSLDSPALRFVQERSELTVIYNDFVQVLGHRVAREVDIQQRGTTIAKLTVTKFASAPTLRETDFSTQESDVKFEGISSKAVTAQIISKVTPHYPEDAKRDHVSGTVLLHILISRDGSIEHLEVISAPSKSIAEAASAAVKQWKYTPFLQNGIPTKVDTGVLVNFSFGY